MPCGIQKILKKNTGIGRLQNPGETTRFWEVADSEYTIMVRGACHYNMLDIRLVFWWVQLGSGSVADA
jgi:hypothetical protein